MTAPWKSDSEQTKLYLNVLDPNFKNHTFQTFDDDKNRKDSSLTRIIHGTLTERRQTLTNLNIRGAGVFIMLNKGDGKGRRTENVVKIRVVYLDLDGAPWEPAAAALKPHMRIESSPGRWHLIWIVSDCAVDQYKKLIQAIIKKYGGDPACCNPAGVLRLPGFMHRKGLPVMTHLSECNETLPTYTVTDIVTAMELSINPTEQEPSSPPADTEQEPSRTHEFTDPATGENITLERWATLHRSFDIIETLKVNAPDVIRGETKDGKQHCTCPFENEHTGITTDLATFVANKKKGKSASFTIQCLHAHCAGRDRLDFLSEMLTKGWLPMSILGGTGEALPPPKVYFPARAIAQDKAWAMLDPAERRIALDLMRIAYTSEDGTLADDDWIMARQLGLDQVDWLQYRLTLTRTGWLQISSGRMWNQLIKAEYDNALSAYNGWCRGGGVRAR
jgi:hypothetical protein